MQLPPLNLNANSSAASRLDMGGSQFGASWGDWTVNVAGSGRAAQSASAGGLNWWLIAAAVGAAWYLWRR